MSGTPPQPNMRINTAKALLPLLFYSAAVPFLRYFLLQRYDLFPALICLLGIWLLGSRRYFLCGLALAVGIGAKLYPAVFVLPLLILATRQGKGKAFVTGLTVGLLPIVVLSFYLPWWRFAEFQTARGLQVESLYASALWLGKLLGVTQLHWVLVKEKWKEVQGPAASVVLPWARLLWFGTVGISIVMALRMAARFPVAKTEKETRAVGVSPSFAARLLLMPLLAFVGFNPVLSPQFMVWLLPLAALTSLGGNLAPALLISVATLLTPISYPSLFGDYGRGLGLLETSILLVRNSILIWVWALSLVDSRRDSQQRMRPSG
ncbi:MAG TPA: glycosyltransferase family 87 protein [Verrucomicrobiae bacterium]|nr:glycosyltransferase family 87 protein [Verrucomicrobiae bacterium]